VYTGLTSLYDDDEVCLYIDCQLIKKVQSINTPSFITNNYDAYSVKVINLFHKFLDGNLSAYDTLTKINDITKIYYFSITSNLFSLVIFISFMIAFFLILFSTVIICIPKFKPYFKFLSKDLWIIYIIGSLSLICSEVSKFGRMTLFKCHLCQAMLTVGYTMIMIPLLYKLIINFPQVNKYSEWIKCRKNFFIYTIIFIEILLNILLFISPFTLKNIYNENSRNFSKCKLIETFGRFILWCQVSTKVIIYLCIIFLLFLEWNIKETSNDIRAFTINMGLDGVLLLLFLILSFISINSYVIYYSLHTCVILLFIITNHTYIFIIRIWFYASNKEKTMEDKLVDKLFNNNNNSQVVDVLKTFEIDDPEHDNKTSKSLNKLPVFKSKILSYHFATDNTSTTTINNINNSHYD